jgi:hypothetical protein
MNAFAVNDDDDNFNEEDPTNGASPFLIKDMPVWTGESELAKDAHFHSSIRPIPQEPFGSGRQSPDSYRSDFLLVFEWVSIPTRGRLPFATTESIGCLRRV